MLWFAIIDIGICASDIPELNKRPCLDRTINIRNISQAKIHQLLVLLLPQPANEARTRHLLPQPICRQAVFCKAEVKEASDGYGGRAELLLLLNEIGAPNKADGAFVTEGRENLEHFGCNTLGRMLVLVRFKE